MIIKNRTEFVSNGKEHSLNENLSPREITRLLGGIKSKGVSGDGKCKFQWDFYADGVPCGIWDYKGCRWSVAGPREVFEKLGML